jgi:hypothetical protein
MADVGTIRTLMMQLCQTGSIILPDIKYDRFIDLRGMKWWEAREDCIMRSSKSSRMRWVGCVTQTGQMRNACESFVEKPVGKRPLGRPRHGWEDNTRLDLREIVWIHLTQDRDQWWAFVNIVINLSVP